MNLLRIFWWMLLAVLLALSQPVARPAAAHLPAPWQPADPENEAWAPLVTPDGRYVFFVSSPDDAGFENGARADSQVFVYDRTTERLKRVDIPLVRGQHLYMIVDVSADGRFLAFMTTEPQGVQPYVLDWETGALQLLNAAPDGAPGDAGFPYESLATAARLSGDGRYALFISSASDLVADDTNDAPDLFLLDRQENLLTRPLPVPDGTREVIFAAHISHDGRYVALDTLMSGLAPDDDNETTDIFLLDRQTGELTLISRQMASPGTTANGRSYLYDLTADGRYILFGSDADDLVAGDTNGYTDLFLYDRDTAEVTRLNVLPDGTQFDEDVVLARISDDACCVILRTNALTPGAGFFALLLLDRASGEFTPIAQDGYFMDISGDGAWIVFDSGEDGLVAQDNNSLTDVFLYERGTGAIRLVSARRE